MTDSLRPQHGSGTFLRRSIRAEDTTLPMLSISSLRLDADIVVGDEYVRCTGFGTDSAGGPTLTGCTRGVRLEDGGSAPRRWPGGTDVSQVGWTAVEIVTEIPIPTAAMVGRQFVFKDANGDTWAFSIALSRDGEPYIDWVNKPPDTGDLAFTWVSLITGLTNITGVALDPSANIYVAHNQNTVRKYNPSLVSQWSQSISTVLYLAADASTVFSSDGLASRVHKRLTSTGASGTPATFGSFGTGNGQFVIPQGVAFDGTNVWVADYTLGRFQKFLPDGTYVSQVTGLTNPSGICLGPTSTHLYVLNAGTGEIRKYLKADHSLVSTFTLGLGNADGQIGSTAEGIAVTSDGRIWIADTPNHRINVYDAAGVFLGSFGSFGSGDGQFKSPKQLAVSAADRVYVADSGNGRLVRVEIADDEVELGFFAYDWDEEFIGGGTTTGAIGERGWTFNGNGSVVIAASTAANPGIITLASGATSGNASRITLGPWVLPQIDEMTFIFATNVNVAGNRRQGVGMGVALSVASPTEGVSVEDDTAIGGSTFTFCKYVGGVRTTVDSGVPLAAGVFFQATFEKTASDTVKVTVLNPATGVEGSTTFTGLSTTAQLDASFFTRTTNNTTKTMQPDYWSGSFSGLSRF